jgi:hypothetical protein
MRREDAYRYHDLALGYLRIQQHDLGLEAAGAEELPARSEVRIAIAIEDTGGDARVALRVGKLDPSTAAVIDDMRSRGAIPEDVRVDEIGRLFGYSAHDSVSPLQPGVSCAHVAGRRGTIGCLLRRGTDLLLLSANHVLALENRAHPGDEIVQPAAGVANRRTVAMFDDFQRLEQVGSNSMDAATALVTTADLTATIFNGKRVRQVRTSPLVQGDLVFKFGQSTEETTGSISAATISNIKLEMDFGDYVFDDHIEVRSGAVPFSGHGDSGALVYDENDLAVGIVIGGDGATRSYVTPIARLLARFDAILE